MHLLLFLKFLKQVSQEKLEESAQNGEFLKEYDKIVENNKTGLLFEPGNVDQLKDCILKYRNNPDIVIEHGTNAYKKTIEKYNEEKYYNELINVYHFPFKDRYDSEGHFVDRYFDRASYFSSLLFVSTIFI